MTTPQKKWRRGNIDRGLCGQCGQNPLKTKTMCEECARKNSRRIHGHGYARARRKRMVASGICICCPRKAVIGQLCRKHARQQTIRSTDHRRSLKRRGICVRCGKEKSAKGKMMCSPCLKHSNQVTKERQKKLIAKGLCISCGARSLVTAVHCSQCRDIHNLKSAERMKKKYWADKGVVK